MNIVGWCEFNKKPYDLGINKELYALYRSTVGIDASEPQYKEEIGANAM